MSLCVLLYFMFITCGVSFGTSLYIVHHNQMLNIRNRVCMLALSVLNVMGNKQWNQVCESAVRHCKISESLMIQRTHYIRPMVEMCCSWAAVQYDIRYVNANANANAFINATNHTEFIYKMPKLLIFPIRANSFSFRVARMKGITMFT